MLQEKGRNKKKQKQKIQRRQSSAGLPHTIYTPYSHKYGKNNGWKNNTPRNIFLKNTAA